jgi:RNA polymerase sigma-B factor
MFCRLKTLDEGTPEYRRQRNLIIERTLPLAIHIARRFKGRGEDYDDLYQVACVGLVSAVDRFDLDKGAQFVPFAVPTIMGEVRRHFRDRGWALKVPRRLKDVQSQLAKARDELAQRSRRAPTPSELAEHLQIDRETVVEATIASSNYTTLSTDTRIVEQGDGAVIAGDTLGSLDTSLAKVVDVESVRPLIEALPERERTVLMLRFFGDMSQTQIAQQLGISQMHVSRLLNRTLDTLRSQVLPPESDSAPSESKLSVLQPRTRRRNVAPELVSSAHVALAS